MAHRIETEFTVWLKIRQETINKLYHIAKELNDQQRVYDSIQIAAKTVNAFGSAITALSILGAPFTGGASLAANLGVVSGCSSLVCYVGETRNENEMIEQVKRVIEVDRKQSKKLKEVLEKVYVDEKKPPGKLSSLNFRSINVALNTVATRSAYLLHSLAKSKNISKQARKWSEVSSKLLSFTVICTLPTEFNECRQTIRSYGSKNSLAKEIVVIAEQLTMEKTVNNDWFCDLMANKDV